MQSHSALFVGNIELAWDGVCRDVGRPAPTYTCAQKGPYVSGQTPTLRIPFTNVSGQTPTLRIPFPGPSGSWPAPSTPAGTQIPWRASPRGQLRWGPDRRDPIRSGSGAHRASAWDPNSAAVGGDVRSGAGNPDSAGIRGWGFSGQGPETPWNPGWEELGAGRGVSGRWAGTRAHICQCVGRK